MNIQQYKYSSNSFKQLTPEACYFFGLLLSDGCLTAKKQIVLSTKEEDSKVMKKLIEYLKTDRPIYSYVHKATGNVHCQFVIGDHEIVDRLERYGLIRNKTYTLIRPRVKIPEKNFHHFVRGYYDGNGCFSSGFWSNTKNIRGLLTISSREPFLKWLNNKIKKHLNIEGCLSKNGKTEGWNLMYGSTSSLEKLHKWLYKDCTDICIQRKKDKFDNWANIVTFSNLYNKASI